MALNKSIYLLTYLLTSRDVSVASQSISDRLACTLILSDKTIIICDGIIHHFAELVSDLVLVTVNLLTQLLITY